MTKISKMIVLKAKTAKAEAKMIDKLYDFAKAIYFGESHNWNGNDIPLAVDEEFIFETEEGTFSTSEMFKKVRGNDPKNWDIKYWKPFVQTVERDKPILQMHIDGVVLDFWIIYPEINGGGWERWLYKNHEIRKDYFNMRISSQSAILLSKHWEKMFETEIKQYYQVAVDKKFLSKLGKHSQVAKTASEMYVVGMDKVILKYRHSSETNHCFNGEFFTTCNVDGSNDCTVTGSTICRSLSEQVILAARSRIGFQKSNIEKFEKELEKVDLKGKLSVRLKSIAGELKRIGHTDFGEDIDKVVARNTVK